MFRSSGAVKFMSRYSIATVKTARPLGAWMFPELSRLFLYTRYQPHNRQRITTLISELKTRYPTLGVEQFKANTGQNPFQIMIKGTLPISVNQKIMGLPITAILPDSFPTQPPIAYLSAAASNAARPFSRIDTARIYTWNSGRSTLCQFFDALRNEYSRNCPVPPSDLISYDSSPSVSGDPVPVEEPPVPDIPVNDEGRSALIREFSDELMKDRTIMNDAYRIQTQYKLLDNACTTCFNLCHDFDAMCGRMEAQLKQTEDTSYQFPPEVLESATQRAAHEAFISVLENELLSVVHNGDLSIEGYVKLLRDKARGHFKSVVLPAISK